MDRMQWRRLRAVILAIWACCAAGLAAGADVDGVVFFERQIRPVLVERCYGCHSAAAQEIEAGLLLDSRPGWVQGGDSGPVLVPGNPEESLLVRALRYEGPEMPPDGQLAERQIRDFEQWIRLGAPDPRDVAAVDGGSGTSIGVRQKQEIWSLLPIRDPPLPGVADSSWPLTPVDPFVLETLLDRGFTPAAPVDRRTWIRRVTFDLTGLPPTPDEVQAFLADGGPQAFERVVDRLLASPQYGERWGRHWLDVVRYADTSGCNGDFPVPDAYRYRNYVIDSFNADKPFDRFVREQVAGDLLQAESDAQRREQVIATGYLAISRRFSSLGEEYHLTLDDAIDNLGKAVLGLSISCARCHDHKFDPIPQEDYYALYGILASTRIAFPGTEIYRHRQHMTPLVPEERGDELQGFLEKMVELDEEIFEVYSYMASLDAGEEKDAKRSEWQSLAKRRDELAKRMPAYEWVYGAAEGDPHDTPLQIKGDPKNSGALVPRGFLQALGGQRVSGPQAGSGRMQLAEWLTGAENPLTARVIANRVWLHHFGRGIVATPDDFGTRGDAPSHPELLDYLASRLIENQWSLKALHRLIVLSQTYRMQSTERQDHFERDPDNRWLSRFNRRRLDAEEIRDAILAISGGLDRSRGGPHPFPPEWQWRYTQHKPFVDNFTTRRRSVYMMQQRIRQQPYLGIFDGADTNSVSGLRKVSTTPLQALFMMNNELVHAEADRFAGRILGEAGTTADRIRLAYRLALARDANEDEIRLAFEYLQACRSQLRDSGQPVADLERAAWGSYLRVLISSNEFVFVD